MDFILLFLVFLIGIANGVLTSLSGGGGLISIPFLIILGLAPNIAIATNTFSVLGTSIGAIPKFAKAKKIQWEYVLPFSILSIIGAFIGASLLVQFPKDLLSKVIGILLILLTLVFLKNRELGIQQKPVTKKYKLLGYLLYFFGAILSGFILGGTGALIIYLLVTFMGFKIIEANATRLIPLLLIVITSSFVFFQNNLINLEVGMVLMAGMAIGGYVGAHFAIKKGDTWVKNLTSIVVLLIAIKLIFL